MISDNDAPFPMSAVRSYVIKRVELASDIRRWLVSLYMP